MAWHDATCAALKLEWEDGRPGCITCQRKAPALSPVHPVLSPPPPRDTKRSELLCKWPPVLLSSIEKEEAYQPQYFRWHGVRYVYDEDAELFDDISANIDGWTASTPTQQLESPKRSTMQSLRQQQDTIELNPLPGPVYSHLPNPDSIRLLRLHGSAARDEPVHCTLELHRLRDPCRPIFEAFSYTWADSNGDSALCKEIFLGPHYDILPVTTNCLASLRQFRTATDRMVWVDAICINQFDLRERGHQVSLMRDIYTSAARVLVYVGAGRVGELPPDGDKPSKSVLDGLAVRAKAILQMPYFSRIWVIQEIMLSNTASVTFNGETMHWKDLLSHLKGLPPSAKAELPGDWIEHIDNANRILWKNNEKDLLPLMMATRNCRCSDARDRVYGLMGLVAEEEQERYSIDYDISIQELYTGLAMYWLMGDRQRRVDWEGWTSDILNLAMLPKSTPFLPSWAPDWTSLSHVDANRECAPTPLTIQFDTTCIEKPSSGLGWSMPIGGGNIRRHQDRWILNKFILDQYEHRTQGKKTSLTKPLPRSSALALDAVDIVSTSMDMVTLTDTHGERLLGLQLASTEHASPEENDSRRHDIHLHILPDWDQFLALRKHADRVYSLYGPCRIVCTPSSPSTFPSHIGQGYNGLRNLQVEFLEHWLMDLFFYGVCAGPAFAVSSRGRRIRNQWWALTPLASKACRASNLPLDKCVKHTERQSIFACMKGILEDVVDFVGANKVPEQRSHIRKSTDDATWTLFGEREGGMFSTMSLSKRTPDAEFAVRIQQAQATRPYTTAPLRDVCTDMEKVVNSVRDSSKHQMQLERALNDIKGSSFEPLVWAAPINPHRISLVYPLLDPIAKSDKDFLERRAYVSLAPADIIHTAWELLHDLKIDPDFTLEQNLNILWIHVLTMEMVGRLRGVLQLLLILKAIDDKTKNVQKIYLI